jgi:predicted TIM-barrel fold metal-dependent hydrolase
MDRDGTGTVKHSGPTSAAIRDALDHPVVDADGHWLEPVPVFVDFLRDEGGTRAVDDFMEFSGGFSRWYEASPAERLERRIQRPGWWGEPANTMDSATVKLPGLLYDRLDELGIDFAFMYPTLGLVLKELPNEDTRVAACRAQNRMAAELFAPYKDRLTPVATIPNQNPKEAVDGIRFAVDDLGLKSILLNIGVKRSIVSSPGAYYLDTFGLDSPYDYDELWAACVDMHVAAGDHGSSYFWPDRQSVSSFVSNHVGHFGSAKNAACRSVFLGGVTRRFPGLNFGFLEGGVGWAFSLMFDLGGHWEKRNLDALERNLRPTNIDLEELRALYDEYGRGTVLEGRAEELLGSVSVISPFRSLEELTAREEVVDDFAAISVESTEELYEQFRGNFYFGCEPDDRTVPLAFDERIGAGLHPVFGSDIGHFDVPDISRVLEEAWELVEDGLISEANFRDLTFANAVRFHGGMNPEIFEGTVVDEAARSVLDDLGTVRG